MFNIIIFSKDRACQLDLLLNSMYYCIKFTEPINVIYKCSNEAFKVGYQKVKYLHPDVNLIEEKSLKEDIIRLTDFHNPYTIFFVDDILIISGFTTSFNEFKEFENNSSVLAFSLRLGRNISYCYPSNTPCLPPEINPNSGVFNWKVNNHYWSYPMSIDGNIYRTGDIMPIISSIPFNNPNEFEYQMALNPIKKPNMICCTRSILVNLAINKVQNYNNNRSGNKYTAEILNNLFLIENKQINHRRMIDKIGINNSCHVETDLIFK